MRTLHAAAPRWARVSALALTASLAIAAAAEPAPDLEREQRLSDEAVEGLFGGEAVYLDADGHRFLAVDTEADTEETRGGVIVLHGRGFHPDWADVVNPLRTALPEHGWRTLSLQMPVLEKEAKYYDYVPIFPHALPRIDAAVRYLREQGLEKIVIVAHSCGVHMSMAWIEARGDGDIDAYVGIGMGATDYQQPMKQPFPLARMRVPVLDIYGSDEYPGVLRNAPRRAENLRAGGNAQSRQVVVPGADHYFRGKNEALVEAVTGWLDGLDL